MKKVFLFLAVASFMAACTQKTCATYTLNDNDQIKVQTSEDLSVTEIRMAR